MSNYVLQIDLGDGFAKADKALDSLLKKVGSLSSKDIDFSMDKAIDDSGILGKMGDIGKNSGKKFADSFFKEWYMTGSKVQGPDLSGKMRRDAAGSKIDWKKILTGIGLGFSNPYVGSRLLSDELGKGKAGGIAGGLFGKGGIAGFSEIFLAFKLFNGAVKIFKKTIEDASQSYSKALQSGMGLNFSIKRNALADIMGVSEKDVFRFGAQMAYLNPKLETATAALVKTNKRLTDLSWGMKIVGFDLKALASQLFGGMSSGIKSLINNFQGFLEVLMKSKFVEDFGKVLNVAIIALGDVVGLIELAINGFVVGMHIIADVISITIKQILNLLSKVPGMSGIGGWDIDNEKKDMVDRSTDLKNQSKGVADNFFGKKAGGIPEPQAWMKQLPASSWEKMGLNVMGGAQNYAKDTAKNTKDIANGIKALVAGMKNKPQNSAWGMSAATANP
jgi:hypothetical protein